LLYLSTLPVAEVTPETTTRDISFTINDGTDPIQSASVVIGSTTKTTGSAGGCSFTGIEEGSVSVTVSKEGYTTKTETITVDSTHTSFTISLVAAESTTEGTG
jgi:propanediol dehydratase large subunit